ncbi:unnamed protein product [Enterobius vermicularis]|uniref:DOMON domain-containing protein n=1 Tax=Enterobius vermicularis TaxID=51028 RepID=A0A0N4UUT7_ENTVE|nr:unnamed protein product [Enterobius vermicularis]
MSAQTLIPAVPLQYMAIGFSHDQEMGNDTVLECVISTDEYVEPEAFASFNNRHSNDRVYLPEEIRKNYLSNVTGGIVDGRLFCQFSVQIIPQIRLSNGEIPKLWSLNKEYYIIAATGSAQPDELNPHDTSPDSYFYPIVSTESSNPSETVSTASSATAQLLCKNIIYPILLFLSLHFN